MTMTIIKPDLAHPLTGTFSLQGGDSSVASLTGLTPNDPAVHKLVSQTTSNSHNTDR